MTAKVASLRVAGEMTGGVGPIEVRGDQEVTFGSGMADAPVDVVLDDPGGEPVAGRMRAADGFWMITNLSRTRTYVVENEDGAGEYVRVPPGRLNMPVPFTRARVVLPSPSGLVSMKVTASEPDYLEGTVPSDGPPDRAGDAFALDATAKYFLVLVALCEPRLRDAATVAIPSTPEIVMRLRGLESCRRITSAAVNFHIDYIARHKLRVRNEWTPPGTGPRVNWQREAIVATALRFAVVREEHLGLLEAF